MAVVKQARRRKWAAQILDSGLTPLDKVRRLVALGYDEQAADAMVSGAQVGFGASMYYEQLPGPDYSER